MGPIRGFSKLSKEEKIHYLSANLFLNGQKAEQTLKSFWHKDQEAQKIFDEFSENTLTNFYIPYGVVPNVLINGKLYCVPMAIEESSVVAACSRSANFWLTRGGVKAEVIATQKIGQVHLSFRGDFKKLEQFFLSVRPMMLAEVAPIIQRMKERGGGLCSLELRDCRHLGPDYYQLWASFETCDAMGANFINTVLETLGRVFRETFYASSQFREEEKNLQIIMAILSNYTPDCLVRAWAECSLDELSGEDLGMAPEQFAWKMEKAVWISHVDVSRATTHNKGIMNGVDGVVLATGNDFRAVEACVHTYAARDGQYRGLSFCEVKDGRFKFGLELPLAVGTVGGLTALHPMARLSLEMLENPSARQLMKIMASIGLYQNFAALRSLTTSGIQKGHMKMHLLNILNYLKATESERNMAQEYFAHRTVSFNDVREFLMGIRNIQ